MTKEHVVPRCLFTKPLPSFMVTIPVCADCNHSKSKDDDYFRDVLVFDIDASDNKTAQQLLDGPVLRSIQKNRSKAAIKAMQNIRSEQMFSPAGIYLGMAYSFPIDVNRINRTLCLIVRGVYFSLLGKRLPNDCKFEIRRLTSVDFAAQWQHLQKIQHNQLRRLGGDVFACIFMYADEENSMSHWWLWFYDNICYSVITCPATYDIKTLKPVDKNHG